MNYEKAFACYKKNYDIVKSLKGKDSIDAAITYNNIGIMHKIKGENGDSESALKEYK